MEQSNKFLKKSFWIITVYSLLIAAGVCYGLWVSKTWIAENLPAGACSDEILKKVSAIMPGIDMVSPYFYKVVIPSTAGVILILGWLLWLILKPAAKTIAPKETKETQKGGQSGKKDFIDRKIEQDRKRRLFLHTLSVLQREGRLLDFFEEDLSLYEDEQIGAAVRSIQEDCKKTIQKYINPKTVLDSEEGDEITIEDGFDIDSINLTGNVSGKPPFHGIVKHSGWKAGKQDIPKLSDIKDAAVIVPAEVEIQ